MLPPIKIKLLDRDKDMNLSQINPVKVKVREIKNNEQNLSFTHPIKVKICDRDKNMGTAYENKKAKVREKDGTVLVKDKRDILETDQILEFLSNDYIKPIRIKISTLDLVYNWLYDLLFKFNFITIIQAGFAIVISFGRFTTKLIFKAVSISTLSLNFGKPIWKLKFKSSVEKASSVFREEGLFEALKVRHKLSGFTQITEKNIPKVSLLFNTPAITDTIIYDIIPRTIGDLTYVESPLGQFTLGVSRLGDSNTIGKEIADGRVVSDLFYIKQIREEIK